jgi:hypothetical protein
MVVLRVTTEKIAANKFASNHRTRNLFRFHISLVPQLLAKTSTTTYINIPLVDPRRAQ